MKTLALGFTLFASPILAETTAVGGIYDCDRGVEIPASYINNPDQSYAVVFVEGRLVTLGAEASASGVRYLNIDEVEGYLWWTKGEGASLYWHQHDDETLLLTCALRLR